MALSPSFFCPGCCAYLISFSLTSSSYLFWFGPNDTPKHVFLFFFLSDPSSSIPADNVWWSTGEHTPHSWRHHPHPDAPRCIPCHYDDSPYVASAEATIPSFKAIKGCPCTPELLCAHNNHSDHMSEDWFNKYCDMPRLPYHMYSMHGGAGALMSIGLMRKVKWDFVEPCVLRTFSTGVLLALLLLVCLPCCHFLFSILFC